MLRKGNAETIFYLMSASVTLAQSMMFTILGVYYVTRVQLNPLQLVLVGTVLEGVYFLFEIPTGVVADTISRKRSIVIGMFILGGAWLLEGSIPLFGAILAAEGIRAVGETFLSGATEAWLADEAGEAHLPRIYIRSGQINRVVEIAGMMLGAAIASWRLNVPILLGGVIFLLLGVFLLIFMGEQNFTPAARGDRSTWQQMGAIFRSGAGAVRGSPILLTLLVVSTVMGISSEGFDRLWEAHFLTNLAFPVVANVQPVVWFAVLGICSNLFGLLAAAVFRRQAEQISQNPRATGRLLVIFSLTGVALTVSVALAGNFWFAFTAFVLGAGVWAIRGPLYDAWLVQHIQPEVRATVLSMMGQMNAIGQVGGGPVIGWVGKAFSLRAALTLAAVLALPNAWLFARAARQAKEKVEDPA